MIGQNFVKSKKLLESGGILLKGKAVEIKEKMIILNKSVIEYSIYPNFPYWKIIKNSKINKNRIFITYLFFKGLAAKFKTSHFISNKILG